MDAAAPLPRADPRGGAAPWTRHSARTWPCCSSGPACATPRPRPCRPSTWICWPRFARSASFMPGSGTGRRPPPRGAEHPAIAAHGHRVRRGPRRAEHAHLDRDVRVGHPAVQPEQQPAGVRVEQCPQGGLAACGSRTHGLGRRRRRGRSHPHCRARAADRITVRGRTSPGRRPQGISPCGPAGRAAPTVRVIAGCARGRARRSPAPPRPIPATMRTPRRRRRAARRDSAAPSGAWRARHPRRRSIRARHRQR